MNQLISENVLYDFNLITKILLEENVKKFISTLL